MAQPEEVSAAAHGLPATICQIVKDDYQFNNEVKVDMTKWPGDFLGLGYNYNIVSILGPQSGGKSTLLNMLFGTDFQVMNRDTRKQTTKGLWLAHDPSKKVLVMDVEGTDSKERGDKHINFERKSALFSLALSEVLIINMWATDVGRYTASNYGTLKIVFEIHLKLFYREGSPKTLLLFILRDHSSEGSTPLDSLAKSLMQDMHNIWDEIQKPDHVKDKTIEDFFDFQFMSLANFIYEKPKFIDEVNTLATRFADRSRSDAIFKDKYSKRIPADGLPEYASRIWATILSEKDLDLPSVKEMLATVRCEEIASGLLAELKKTLEPSKAKLERGATVEDFGAKLKIETENALKKYDEKGSLYHETVYKMRREQLQAQLVELTEPLKQLMARNVMDQITRELEVDVLGKLSRLMNLAEPNMWSQVGEVYLAAVENIEKRLKDLAKELDAQSAQEEAWLGQARQAAAGLVKRKARDETREAAMKAKLVDRFKEHFLYSHEDGVRLPREFTPQTDVQEEYKNAMRLTMPLVELFASFELPAANGDEPERVVLLEDAEVQMHNKKLEEYVADVYKQAKSDQRGHVSMQAMPIWVFIAFFILGFNEFMWFVRFIMNPANLIVVFMSIGLVSLIVICHRLGALGAVEAVAMAFLKELLNQMNQGLGSFLQRFQQPEGVTAAKKDD
eukprot:comp23257_c0_seq1/m.38007 comp23257_c0_seq1/g.38007  ORF comp23257_c0_seq1/g.38007 comp23257_c0_seq1/m.38007 type:complete len:677 (-) comp23257_c0_seq1:655-2685(-)